MPRDLFVLLISIEPLSLVVNGSKIFIFSIFLRTERRWVLLWKHLRSDLRDGDIEQRVEGEILRGRIREVVIKPKVVEIYVAWLARFNPDPHGRIRWEIDEWPDDGPLLEISPHHRLETQIDHSIRLLDAGAFTLLFPCGVDNLDPNQVYGLHA
jgi:hypothetical protein